MLYDGVANPLSNRVVGDAAGNGVSAATTYSITDSILTLGGAGASAVDTLGEWVAQANAVTQGSGALVSEVVAFEFNGSTYVFAQNGNDDVLVELDGLVGASKLDIELNPNEFILL